MLIRPGDKVLEALASLELNGNFKIVMDWLEQSQKSISTTLRSAESTTMYRAQGAALTIDMFIDSAKTARDTLSKKGQK